MSLQRASTDFHHESVAAALACPPASIPLSNDPHCLRYPAAVASLAAFLVAAAICGILPVPTLIWTPASWFKLLLYAAATVALTVGAGEIGIQLVPSRNSSAQSTLLSTALKPVWALLPAIVLLDNLHTAWILAVVALTSILAALRIRRLLPALEEVPETPAYGSLAAVSPLPTVYGLPSSRFPLRPLLIALFLQTTLLFLVRSLPSLAAAAFAAAIYLAAWQWSAARKTASPPSSSRPLYTLAYALAVLALMVPWVAGEGGRAHGATPVPGSHSPGPAAKPGYSLPDRDYIGIILWPPPPKKVEIVAPNPRSLLPGAAARPIFIPFDGPYLYFRDPLTGPGPDAHIAHGKPTDVHIRSTDFVPLRMEARQNLGLPIDLRSCGSIDVAITNADTHPGLISLAILLTDSTSPGHPYLSLGAEPVPSTQSPLIPASRPPVKEVLHFIIPRHAALQRFNGITILFRSAPQRAQTGARISIDSFELQPR